MSRRIGAYCFLLAWFLFVPCATAEELVIAFTPDTPPYVLDKGTRGISIEVVRAALRPKGYTFTVRQMPYGQLADAVATKGVDAAASVIEADDGTYYSDNYVEFRNAAITKKRSAITIDAVADLKGKSILAWQNAYKDLGPEFQALFSPNVKDPYRKKYREFANQANQVEMFWKDEADVIVIGELVMKWFTRELADRVDTSDALVYHRVFPPETRFRISFKSKQVRDDFNAGLEQIRKSGLYQQIVDKYQK